MIKHPLEFNRSAISFENRAMRFVAEALCQTGNNVHGVS